MFLLLAGLMGTVFFALSPAARAGGFRGGGGFGGAGGFRGGAGFRGGGLHGQFMGRGHTFATGRGFRRGNRFFVQQSVWPYYWYPYDWGDYYPLDYSLLDNDNDYQVASIDPPVQQGYDTRSSAPAPVVVVVNQGNPGSGASSSGGHANSNYGATGTEGQQNLVAQKSNEQMSMGGADSSKAVTPGTQAAPATVQAAQAVPKAPAGGGSKYVLVSWLNFSGKDVLYVKNTETNQVEKITSEPNRDNFRIVEVHPNEDPQEFEAIISNGSGQIPVRFGF